MNICICAVSVGGEDVFLSEVLIFFYSLPTEALKGMEKVAEHINEMQRIHEEYGAIFDHLFRQHQKACKQPIDLSPGKFHGAATYVFFMEEM